MFIRGNTESARSGRERGAAVVEMAFVAPLLIILLLGIFTVARAYNVKNTMDHAVREGARFGATIDPWDARRRLR
jgi:Flp pilus assembly protein TadG